MERSILRNTGFRFLTYPKYVVKRLLFLLRAISAPKTSKSFASFSRQRSVILYVLESVIVMALRGIRVVEFLGLAPGPFCGMLLSDFGAGVTILQKIEPSSLDVLSNGKRAIAVNLKTKEGVDVVRRLCGGSDVVLDTFRPGVLERLGLGPDILLLENPRLVYARLTGYGQSGPWKNKGGHDINYAAMSGVLTMLSCDQKPPVPPVNILADFGGGGLLCAFAILAALMERVNTGKGQVVDASMTEGAAYLSSWLFRSRDLPIWTGKPGTNILDGGAPFYSTYRTKDGRFMSVGCLEPQFYEAFVEALGLTSDQWPQFGNFDKMREKFSEIFASKAQEEWCKIFTSVDACVEPVLETDELMSHEQHSERKAFIISYEGHTAPQPAPRLSRTPAVSRALECPPSHGQHTSLVLQELGYSADDIKKLSHGGHVLVPVKSTL